MDMSNSQYNSASESGWTNYLNQSSFSETQFNSRGSRIIDYEGNGARMEEEEEEEDLSMISDASSGPPNYNIEEDDQPYFLHTKESEKKVKENVRNHQQLSLLDDTASSPVLNYPKKKGAVLESTLDFSPSLSATRIKSLLQRKPKFQKQSFGGKQATEEPGGFNEEERK